MRTPSATAPRGSSSAATFLPSSSTARVATASSDGSPSAAASAPTMTRLTNFEPPRRSAGTQRTSSRRARRRAFGVQEQSPPGYSPSRDVDLAHERRLEHDDDVRVRDRVVAADRPVVDARVRAQRRAAPLRPVLGERLDALARRAAARPRRAATRSSRPAPRARASGSLSSRSLAASVDRRARRASPRARPRRRWRRRCRRRPRRSTSGCRVGRSRRRRRSRRARARARRSTRGTRRAAAGRSPSRRCRRGSDELASPGPARAGAGRSRRARRARIATALDRLDAASVPRKRTGTVSHWKRDALLARLVDLVRVRGHLGLGAAVDERHVARAEPRAPRAPRRPPCCRRRSTTTCSPTSGGCAGLDRLDERQRLPDARQVVARVADVGVGAHADGEDDRVASTRRTRAPRGASIAHAELEPDAELRERARLLRQRVAHAAGTARSRSGRGRRARARSS